jgi:ATP-dependent helicase HrpA
VRALADDCVTAAAGELVDQTGPVRDPEAFATLVTLARAELPARSEAVLQQVLRVLAEWRPVDKALHGRVEMSLLPAMTDLRAQLGRLVGPGFIAEAGAEALRHYPRYLRAMSARVDRLGELARDRELMDRVEVLQQAWQHRVEALPEGRPQGADLRRVRWMLEEFRVSLWAQQLGTSQPVSDARIRKALG